LQNLLFINLPLVTSIGDGAFTYCMALTTIIINPSVDLGVGVFDHDSSLSCISNIDNTYSYSCSGCAATSLEACLLTTNPTQQPSHTPIFCSETVCNDNQGCVKTGNVYYCTTLFPTN
jgi:hypothetical protein